MDLTAVPSIGRRNLLAFGIVGLMFLGGFSSPGLRLFAATPLLEIATRSGDIRTGRLQTWTSDALTLKGNEEFVVPVSDILTLDFPGQPVKWAAGSYVELTNSDRLALSTLRVVDEHLQGTWTRAPLRTEVRWPLEQVRGMCWGLPPARTEIFDQLTALKGGHRGHDTALFLTGDELQGELRALDGGLVDFAGPLGPNSLDIRRLRSITLDPDLAATPALPEEFVRILLTDGSRLTVQRLIPRNDFTLQLVPFSGDPWLVTWQEVARVLFVNAAQTPLATKTSSQEQYIPFLQGTAAVEKDQNARAWPLVLRGRESTTGLGMLSQMTVTYPLAPGDRAFRAVIGIDDAAGGQGSVIFQILIDGELRWSSPEVDGTSPPLPTPFIDLTNHRELTLKVDFANRGDIGDLADWCDALILREPIAPAGR